MNREEMLKRLKVIEAMEVEKLEDNGLSDNVQIDNVKYLGNAALVQDIDGKKEQIEINVYAVIEDKTIKYYSDDMCLGIETVNVGNGEPAIIPSPEYLRMYEKDNPIKDVINNLKIREREEQQKLKEERTTVSLNELEEEEKKEQDGTKASKKESKDEKDVPRRKRKPSHVIEAINPDKAKMDYWQTIKQAFGLPPQVATLAFAYPVSSEDKVDYANITIYMLDKDGYIIDDLKVDDYFEFDTATGNNPMQDKTVRLEEDENNGKVQTEENRTMIRLKSKKNPDSNSYISLEQINTLGDYNDINAGSKVKGSINNIEKQLETDHVRVWDSESEKTRRGNAGEYKGREIYEEIQSHKEHNAEEQYVDDLDADGIEETFECIGEHDWKELATKWGYYKNGKPDEEKARRVYEEYKYNNPQLSDEEVVQEVSDDLYEQTPGRRNNR